MPAPITKHLKRLSILDLNRLYATEEQQVAFFYNLKWPEGFKCPKCGHIHYTYYAARHLYECTRCHHHEYVAQNEPLASELTMPHRSLIIVPSKS